MIISDKIIKLLEYRIEQEEFSSRIYWDMAMCLQSQGYIGASQLFKKYAKEEITHAEKAYDYLQSLAIRPAIPALKAPANEYSGLPEILKLALKHELEVTNQCRELAKASQEEGDYMTLALAQWYLTEQVEEIDKTVGWVDKLNILGGANITPEALYLLDNELGEASK